MFGARFQLFRLWGIPISVDASWLLVVALLTWTLTDSFQRSSPGLAVGTYWLMGLVATLVFFACIVLHELGHAVVAKKLGIPMRGITLFLFGGVAEMGGEPPSAGKEFLVAIAGPVVSAILAAGFAVLSLMAFQLAWAMPLAYMFSYLTQINALVLFFNLVPAFPLDGGRVLRAILWGGSGDLRQATRWASLCGQGFAWLLIGFGVLLVFGRDLLSGMWLVLIGLFLNQAARSSYQQVLAQMVLQREPIRRFMNATPIVVPPTVDLRHWVEDYVYRYHHKAYPVAANGRLEGIINTEALSQFPRAEWDQHTVAQAMSQDLEPISLPPDADAFQALAQMQRTGSSRLLVTDQGQLVGIVSLKDLLRFLELKLELEKDGQNGAGVSASGPAGKGEDMEASM